MADVWIDQSSVSAIARNMRSAVFVSTTVGYWFSMDGAQVWGYRKTTDGGATWGAHVPMEASATCVASDVWFDKWTPGDSGTLVHTWWMDATLSGIQYRTLDTATDTLGSTVAVFDGVSFASGRGVFCSGAKSRSGYLYCAYDIDAGAEKGLARSTDGGANWSVLDTGFVEATIDQCLLLPASGTGDDNDIWAVYHDASADELTLKMWDSSAAGEVESSAIMSLVENTTDAMGQIGFSGSVRHSDGHLIVVGFSSRDLVTTDCLAFDINGTGSITALTAITTDIDDMYYPAVYIDQLTDDIYVAYNGKRDGSQTIGTNAAGGSGVTQVFYVKSTDDGATWNESAYSENNPINVMQVWVPLTGPRFYAGWRQQNTSLSGGYTNSVVTGAVAATARPVVFVCT